MSEDQNTEEWMRRLDAYINRTDRRSLLVRLTEQGWRPPSMNEITDEDIQRELTNLIWSLKDMQVYISHSDHLSDAELYIRLLEYCSEETMYVAGVEGAMMGWSGTDSGTDEDEQNYLRYYADEGYRQRLLSEFPKEGPLPEHQDPPYPRPWIPKAPY